MIRPLRAFNTHGEELSASTLNKAPFGKSLKAAHILDIFPSNLDDHIVWHPANSPVTDRATHLYRLTGSLCLQPCIDVYRHIRLREIQNT